MSDRNHSITEGPWLCFPVPRERVDDIREHGISPVGAYELQDEFLSLVLWTKDMYDVDEVNIVSFYEYMRQQKSDNVGDEFDWDFEETTRLLSGVEETAEFFRTIEEADDYQDMLKTTGLEYEDICLILIHPSEVGDQIVYRDRVSTYVTCLFSYLEAEGSRDRGKLTTLDRYSRTYVKHAYEVVREHLPETIQELETIPTIPNPKKVPPLAQVWVKSHIEPSNIAGYYNIHREEYSLDVPHSD